MFDNVIVGFLEILFVGCVFIFVEKFRPVATSTTDIKHEKLQEFILSLFNLVFSTYIILYILDLWLEYVLTPYFWHHVSDPFVQVLPFFIQVFLGALILDLSKYWQHRMSHRYMWKFHAIHHSAKELTWITGLRLHPVEIVVASIFDTTFLFILGFSGNSIVIAILLLRILNFVIHANLNLKYDKPLRYILASPHYHRWHHANQKSAYDKNFAGAFPFWDMLFGTYYHPEELPKAYGLSSNETKFYPKYATGWLLYPFKKLKKKDGI
tara:strand:+ start:24277 stop:25077 length:801 start_codon:yes stop_codon:yes gene_type:complete